MPYVDAIGGAALTDDTVNSLFKVCHTVNAFSTRARVSMQNPEFSLGLLVLLPVC